MSTRPSDNPIDEYVETMIRKKARQLVHSPGFSLSDREDIEQDLRLHLLLKLPHFDPAKASRATFANRIIESKAKDLIRYRTADMRDPAREQCSVNEMIDDGEGGTVARVATMTREDHQRRLRQIG